MSEAVTPPVEAPAVTPPVDTPPVETPPSGLPSDNSTTDYSGFDMSDSMKEKFKDGKLNGRFSSMDDVLEKLKEAEDFKAQTIRESKEGGQQQQQQQTQEQAQIAVVTELLPSFVENGMVLTPEMETKLTDGITNATEKELAIYKFRDQARAIADRSNNAYAEVGGKDNYNAMQEWGKENLSDAEKKVFTSDVNGSPQASTIAIQWLNAKYQKALADGTVTPRIQGKPHVTGIKPYADRRELYKDKDYVESKAGQRDTVAIKRYRDRKRITPDAVIFGTR